MSVLQRFFDIRHVLSYLNIGCFCGGCFAHFDPWWGCIVCLDYMTKLWKGFILKDLANCAQKRLLFAPNFFLFRAVKTSLSAIAQLFRLPFRPMLSIFSYLHSYLENIHDKTTLTLRLMYRVHIKHSGLSVGVVLLL